MAVFDQGKFTRSDEELVVALQQGELASFTELMRRYEEKIERYLKHLVGLAEASDITQETFLKVYQNIQSFDAERRFSPWLYRVAHNVAVNWLRREGRMKSLTFSFDTVWPASGDTEESPIFEPVSTEAGPDRRFEGADKMAQVESCLNNLDIKYREVLYLRYWEDFSYEQISDALRIPVPTVGVRLKRAKVQLMLELKRVKDPEYVFNA